MKKVMKDYLEIKLKYSGKEVDDGSMSLDDFLPVMQGFSSAYSKIAYSQNITLEHTLRIVAIEKGSVDFILQAWQKLGEVSGQIQAVPILANGVKNTVSTILKLIGVTKHIKKQPFQTKISHNQNCIIVTNNENVDLEIPIGIFNLFKEGTVASDLAKMVRPLEKGRIDKAEIIAKGDNYEEKEIIIYQHKDYFDVGSTSITTTKETWLMGKFNSLTKSTNRGYFFLTDGTRVTYELKAEDPETMYPFFIYKGIVQVRCIVHLDENLKPNLIDIFDIKRVQEPLFKQNDKKK